MKHKIIYIPGLGDGYDPLRKLALRLWTRRDVSVELVPMRWSMGDSYERAFDRVHRRVVQSQQGGYTVSLIGESAGGAMAINMFATHDTIHRLITIAGVNSPKAPVAQHLRDTAPAFDGALLKLPAALSLVNTTQRRKIINFTARADPTVAPRHSRITGAQHHTVAMIGHLTTIAFCLTFARKKIIDAITR